MGKLTLGIGLGIGYVLGARAGRERYEQIVQSAQGFLGRPEVQQTLDKAREAAPAPLQGSIDKLAGQASGGSSSGGSGSSGGGGGTSSAGTSSAGTSSAGTGAAVGGSADLGTPDIETLAEAVVVQDTLETGTGTVPDPLIPPAKSNG